MFLPGLRWERKVRPLANSYNRKPNYLAQRRKGDEPIPIIPSECEGSKKDFSLRSK
jgi:hypothetical protein